MRLKPALRGDRKGEPITQAACWSHGRRKFFVLARCHCQSAREARRDRPLALEAVQRHRAIFDAEREINGRSAPNRVGNSALSASHRSSRISGVDAGRTCQALPAFRGRQGDGLHAQRWKPSTRFLDEVVFATNNAADARAARYRARPKVVLFAGSDRGGETGGRDVHPDQTARLKRCRPQAWLADVPARIKTTTYKSSISS